MKTDMLGQVIQTGDIIVTPGRYGSTLYVNISVILDVHKRRVVSCGASQGGTLINFDRSVKIKPSMILDTEICKEVQTIFDDPRWSKYLKDSNE